MTPGRFWMQIRLGNRFLKASRRYVGQNLSEISKILYFRHELPFMY